MNDGVGSTRGNRVSPAAAGPRSAWSWPWLAAFVPLTIFSFPQLIGTHVVDLGLVCGWLGPAALLLGLRGSSPGRAARDAFLVSWLAYAGIMHWIYWVTVTHGHAPALIGIAAPFGVALFSAVIAGFFGWTWAWLGRLGVATPMTAALLWVACDHLRTFLLGGFPWALLGYAQHENELLLRLAPYTGVLGLSFVTALGGGALASLTTARPGARRRSRAGGLTIVAILALHGVLAAVPRPGPEAKRPTVRVAALQGNIDQSAKWSRERFLETVAIYEDLSVRAAAEGAEIVVWPETAIAGPLGLIPDLGQRLSELASRIGASLVVGAVGVEVDPSHGEITHYYDSAFAYHADGSFAGRYDKSHLVPFGEYVPLRSLLGGLLAAAARGVAPMDVTAGAAPASMDLNLAADSAEPGSGPQGQRVKVGIPICYELLFPDLVRHFVADGAGVLLAITNDAWYGRTGAPYQFLVMTAMRSAETGVWTVRAANTGVSAIIDGTGHTRRRTAIFEAGYVIDDIPLLPPEDERSFYVRHGNVFALSCWLALGVVGTIAGLARRENARTPRDESRGRQR